MYQRILHLIGIALLPISSIAAPTTDVMTGRTSVALSDEFVAALQGLGTIVRKVIPGQIVPGKGELRFPISGGAVDSETGLGEIIHTGGVNIAVGDGQFLTGGPVHPRRDPSDGPSVSIVDPILHLPASSSEDVPTLSAIVVANGNNLGRVVVATLTFSQAAPPDGAGNGARKLTFGSATLALTEEAATAFNDAFASTAFTAGLNLGTASVKAIGAMRKL
jgi:hypothetical protein